MFLALIISTTVAFSALTQSVNLSDFRKTNFGPSLSDNYIVSITEDCYGFIWLATREDIARFDGISYHSLDNSITKQIFSGRNIIHEIKFKDNGEMLVCTNGGLFCVNVHNNSLKYSKALSGYAIYSIPLLRNDKWALMNTGAGIILYDFSNDSTELLKTSYDRGIDKTAKSAAVAPDGNIWLCERNLVKLTLDMETAMQDKCPSIDELVTGLTEYYRLGRKNDIAIDSFGKVWLWNSRDLMTATVEGIEKGEKPDTVQKEVTAIDFEKNNAIIGIRGNGSLLLKRDNDGNTVDSLEIRTSDHLDDMGNTVNDYYYDGYNIWIGTRDGLYCMEDNDMHIFKNINNSSGNGLSLSHNTVNEVMVGMDGTVWVATSLGLNRVDFSDDGQYRTHNYLPEEGGEKTSLLNKIECFTETEPGLFWVGTKSDLLIFNSTNGTFQRNPSTDAITGSSRFVRALCQDRQQNIWIGYQNGGVYFYHKETNTTFKVPIITDGKILDDCTAIACDRDGYIWIGSRKHGLIRIKSPFNPSESTDIYYPGASSGPDNPELITSIFIDLYDTVWCGTEEGLFKYNSRYNRFDCIRISELEATPYISGIIDDDRGNLWISSDTGIYRYNPYENSSRYFELYGRNFTRRHFTSGMAKGRDGRIYCSGINGLTYFFPDRIKDVEYGEMNIMFTDFRIGNNSVLSIPILEKDINDTGKIVLSHDNNRIAFAFCVPGFISNKNVLYSYRLDGYDKDWTVIGYDPKYINYGKLPAGKYTLELKCNSTFGNWAENIRTLEIVVRPPFLLSWYMVILYIVILSGIAFSLYKITVKKEERRQRQVINESRMKFYRDLFYNLKTPYSIMQAPLHKLKVDFQDLNDSQIKEMLDSASKGSNLLYMQLEQLSIFCDIDNGVYTLNESCVDFISFSKKIAEAFSKMCESKNIKMSFHSEVDRLPMVCDCSKMEIIFFNLLSNAFKYTPVNGQIEVSCRVLQNEFVLVSISDNGPGILPENREKIFRPFWNNDKYGDGVGVGLPLAKALVELHGGKISVDDNNEKGCTFTFTLPIKTAAISNAEMLQGLHSTNLDAYIESMSSDLPAGQYMKQGGDLIYIVEKDANLRDMFDKILTHEYRMAAFPSPEGVLEKAMEDRPSLIISGAVFPGNIQGLDLCRNLKSSQFTNSIPFLFLTGYNNPDFERNAFEVGADGIITKPFDMDYLLMRIKQVIQFRKSIKEKVRKDIITTPKELTVLSSDDKFLAQAKQLLEKHIGDESFNITEFASGMNVSISLLHRKIKALTDMTPNDYLKDFRLKRAVQLLKSKAFNVSEISYQVGFNDVKYFSTCFKKKYGVTPSSYLKESENP